MIAATAEARLRAYLGELYRWNVRINLTAVPEAAAWERHVGDVLRLLGAVPPPPAASVVDVGSGAGVPGLPLAVLRPDLRLSLVEADRRKAGFLQHVAGRLELDNVTVLAVRAETAGHDPSLRETFDVAVSRAAAPLPSLCELALPLVRVGGELVALVASREEDIPAARAAARECGGGPPREAGPGVVALAKESATPERYPRRPGIPARRPLSTGA